MDIIGVRDVPGSFKWYQSLFGQPETPPGHEDFGQILDTDGTVLLCLHQWGCGQARFQPALPAFSGSVEANFHGARFLRARLTF